MLRLHTSLIKTNLLSTKDYHIRIWSMTCDQSTVKFINGYLVHWTFLIQEHRKVIYDIQNNKKKSAYESDIFIHVCRYKHIKIKHEYRTDLLYKKKTVLFIFGFVCSFLWSAVCLLIFWMPLGIFHLHSNSCTNGQTLLFRTQFNTSFNMSNALQHIRL